MEAYKRFRKNAIFNVMTGKSRRFCYSYRKNTISEEVHWDHGKYPGWDKHNKTNGIFGRIRMLMKSGGDLILKKF